MQFDLHLLRTREEWFFFCRVQFHRELLKKKKRIFLYSLVLGFNQNGKLSSFPSSPFHSTYRLSIKTKVTLSSTLCVCGERDAVSITSNFINSVLKKKTNYYIFYCSLSEFYIKYMFIPNSIHHLTDQIPKLILLYSPKYTSKPTSPCGLDSLF